METIYSIIADNPDYFAWAFGLLNILWIALAFFLKARHQKELTHLKQSLDLDLERRKRVFEMKASQYEVYFKNLDKFHNSHQTDYQDVVLPIINDFNEEYLNAASSDDKAAETKAITRFSERFGEITRDGFLELQVMRSETNSLRLTASDEIATLLDEIQTLYEELFELSNKMISDLGSVMSGNNQALADENQSAIELKGKLVLEKANMLREAMRSDLQSI